LSRAVSTESSVSTSYIFLCRPFIPTTSGRNPQKQAKVKEYERQIDELVYKLYGLTDEEIKIVEESKWE